MHDLKEKIKQKSRELGFDSIGFTKPNVDNQTKRQFKKFLKRNYHGEMKWLERHYQKKINPKMIWNEVETVIVLGLNYGPKVNPILKNKSKKNANASIYANNKDYHNIIKSKLDLFVSWFRDELNLESKIFVDSSPILEKYYAKKTGIGWQGKHTNIVSKDFGSWLFLSEIFLPINLEKDEISKNNCGECSKCLEICPTSAIIDDYKINAKKCISYLTIEYKGPIPMSLRKKIGNKIYGCDDCLSICPWNKFSKPTYNRDLLSSKNNKELSFFLKFDKNKFEKYYSHSPIKRIGWVSFMRNIINAAGNSENELLIQDLKKLAFNENPIIRGACVWSLSQLLKNKKNKVFEKIKKNERNKYVLFELDMINKFL
tara:strand:- start:553 stop:1668 length:1116 start_codon:yes stop_codon:yes gene_type:complete